MACEGKEQVAKLDALDTLVYLLTQGPLCRGMPRPIVQEIAKLFERRQFSSHQCVFREGEPLGGLFVIGLGSVTVVKADAAAHSQVPIHRYGPGDVIGLTAIEGVHPSPFTAVAENDVTGYWVDAERLRHASREFPDLAWNLAIHEAAHIEEVGAAIHIGQVSLHDWTFDSDLIRRVPMGSLIRHQLLPLAQEGHWLWVGMVDPRNLAGLDEIRLLFPGCELFPVAVSEGDFRYFMAEQYPRLVDQARPIGSGEPSAKNEVISDILTTDLMREFVVTHTEVQPESVPTITDLTHSAEDPPIIRLANNILGLAILEEASDIHLEPQEDDLLVRLRVDGVLREAKHLPKRLQLPLISRFKIISNLNIAEHRLPQDGRISVKQGERVIDFRVSTIPTKFGEKVVMRLLDKANTVLGLDKLVTHPGVLAKIREMIGQPYGIIFVTGPTGSGKTTTLYAALSELNEPGVNISTVEDPIEYQLPRVNQVQVHKEIGLDFARVLRAFLRQDPDVILVGETRDQETAKTAVEAALTGHLVFTTLHTNNAAASFMRLAEMGVERFLIASATIGIVAQRLARRLCGACREGYVPDGPTLDYLGWPKGKEAQFYRAVGCSGCKGSGYRGRVGIYEVLRMNAPLRSLVAQGHELSEIQRAAVEMGMMDLKAYSLYLLERGDTTVEEILSIVSVTD